MTDEKKTKKAPAAKKAASPKASKEAVALEDGKKPTKPKTSAKAVKPKKAVDTSAPATAEPKAAKPKKKAVAAEAAAAPAEVPAKKVPAKKVKAKAPAVETKEPASPPAAKISSAPAVPPKPAPAAPPKPAAVVPPAPPAPPRPKIKVNEMVTVKELADKMNVKVPDVLKKFMSLGKIVHINQRVDVALAGKIADSFQFDLEVVPTYADEVLDSPDDPSLLRSRPPVVTVMGHVDHGKTSLLDAIRKTRVAEKEAGGITQHIGAYQVKTEKGYITFLDTPGHEAFTAMRARGAQATDLVILVVAADDGVMPQTVEAIDHAQAAGVPIVVAINKCDLPTANPQRIKQELTKHKLIAEDWGGKTVMVEVSARQNKNLDTLLEMILLESELLELKANPNRPAQGVVVEAKLDPRRGAVATVLVQKGTLRVGDAFVCGLAAGKVRALLDYAGQRGKEAPPSCPVEILGFSTTPRAGDKFMVVASEREAREIAERRQAIASDAAHSRRQHLTLEGLHDEVAAGKIKFLPIVLKADVQGSLEPVRDSLEKLATSEISLKIIHSGIGGINASDVILAAASDAVIFGFNVRPDPSSEELARREGVEIKTYRIIYEMVNVVKAALEGLLSPAEQEVTSGWAEVRQVFRVPKAGTVAGCYVTDGRIVRSAKVRLVRDGAIVFDGAIANLKRFKEDVREVEKGFECGLSLEGFQDVKPQDRIEFYIIEKKARKL
ncbi:MAG TPA: translation initiation factor IF-2 [Elusimicrobiota bacterium]|nr:translation initiation factor IF-2 [Elusimicrobiota bacterium]